MAPSGARTSPNRAYCYVTWREVPAGPTKSGSLASVRPGKSSPCQLTRPSSPQRASARCSCSVIARRSGQTRRTEARRTHGSASSASRTASGDTAKKLPRTALCTAASTSARVVCCSGAVTSTSRTGNSAECSSSQAPAAANASKATPTKAPAIMLSSRGLSHTGGLLRAGEARRLEDLHAQVFVREADGARGHRHEGMRGHAGRGIDLEEGRLAPGVEHEIHPSPSRAADQPEGAQRELLKRLFPIGREPGGAVVLRLVGEVLVLVVVVSLRRLDANERQRRLAENARGVFRPVDELLGKGDVGVLACGQLVGR